MKSVKDMLRRLTGGPRLPEADLPEHDPDLAKQEQASNETLAKVRGAPRARRVSILDELEALERRQRKNG